jgi:dephospho-CoA kinase
VLVTGMSGVGKSSVAEELRRCGFLALDTDADASRVSTDGEWLWDETKVKSFLDASAGTTRFVVGSASNQVRFYERFDFVLLLSAPTDVMLERVRARTNNPFGHSLEQRQKIVADKEQFEPMIRGRADAEITTDRPLTDVVDQLLAITSQ